MLRRVIANCSMSRASVPLFILSPFNMAQGIMKYLCNSVGKAFRVYLSQILEYIASFIPFHPLVLLSEKSLLGTCENLFLSMCQGTSLGLQNSLKK